LEQRNTLLKHQYEIGVFQREPLEIWDEQLTRYGKAIHEKRVSFIAAFVPLFQYYYQWISEQREQVELNYESALHDVDLLDLLQQAELEKSDYGKVTQSWEANVFRTNAFNKIVDAQMALVKYITWR
jgi:recombinational DNA repair ATPase RecF